MKVRRTSISKQIMFILTILLLVGDFLIGFVVYSRMQALFMEKIQENASNLACCAAASIDAKQFENVIETGDEKDYQSVLDQLSLFLKNSSLEYVYTFAKNGEGDIFFVVDADPEEPAELNEVYDDVVEGMETAFAGTPAVDEEPSKDEWGTYVSAYAPIKDDKTIIGIVGVDVSYTQIQKEINQLLIVIIGICIGVFVMLFGALLWISKKMQNGFTILNDKIVELADGSGNLNKQIHITSGDEFEVIGDSVNSFIFQLKNLVGQVVTTSNGNARSIQSINQNTQNVSANMEQCSASTQMVSEQLQMAADQMREMHSEVEQATKRMEEATVRADAAAQMAVLHRTQSEEQIAKLREDIGQVMKQAESVKQVQKINEKILSIVRETRILSMNAQLEAAKAGEAGKGFAVVATQVAELSEDISDAVIDIGDINEQVMLAMEQMVEYMDHMYMFLNESVVSDYVEFAKMGEDYGQTTILMQQWMQDLKAESFDVARTVDGVSESISEISRAVYNSAEQIEQLCGSTIEIADDIERLLEIPIMKS